MKPKSVNPPTMRQRIILAVGVPVIFALIYALPFLLILLHGNQELDDAWQNFLSLVAVSDPVTANLELQVSITWNMLNNADNTAWGLVAAVLGMTAAIFAVGAKPIKI